MPDYVAEESTGTGGNQMKRLSFIERLEINKSNMEKELINITYTLEKIKKQIKFVKAHPIISDFMEINED